MVRGARKDSAAIQSRSPNLEGVSTVSFRSPTITIEWSFASPARYQPSSLCRM